MPFLPVLSLLLLLGTRRHQFLCTKMNEEIIYSKSLFAKLRIYILEQYASFSYDHRENLHFQMINFLCYFFQCNPKNWAPSNFSPTVYDYTRLHLHPSSCWCAPTIGKDPPQAHREQNGENKAKTKNKEYWLYKESLDLGRYVGDTWDNLSNGTNKSTLPFNSTLRRVASNTNGRHRNNPVNRTNFFNPIHQQPEFLNVRFVVAYPQNLSFYLFFCFPSIKWVPFRKPDFKNPICLP